jgi:hypothetical protein
MTNVQMTNDETKGMCVKPGLRYSSTQLTPQPKSFSRTGAKAQRNQLAMPFEFSAPLREKILPGKQEIAG